MRISRNKIQNIAAYRWEKLDSRTARTAVE